MATAFFIPQKNEINDRIHLTVYSAILIYIVSLFSEYIPVITNIMMGLIFVCSILLLFKERKRGRHFFSNNKVLIGLILFFLFELISNFFSTNKKEGFAILASLTPFLLFALSFCFMDFKQVTWNRLLCFYAIATTFASVYGFGAGVYDAISKHDTGFLYNDNICFILGKQAVYFAYYVSVALFIFILQLQQQTSPIRNRGWIYLSVVWLLLILFLLASRMGIFGFLLIGGIYMIQLLFQYKKYMELAILCFSFIIGSVILVKLFPKTLNRFKGTTNTEFQFDNYQMENHFNLEYDASKWNGTNTRAAIWSCALEVWKVNPLIGTTLGDKNDILRKKFEEKKFYYAVVTDKNTHNQYLDILMGMGILGLAIFLICYFVYPFWHFFKYRQTLAIMIFLMLALCLATENMFNRYQGVILLAFLLPTASKIRSSDNNTKIDTELETS